MKKLLALGLSVFLGACAAQSGDENAAATDQAATTATGAPATLSVEACQGRQACVDALVFRAIFTSDAVITSEYDEENAPKKLAREVMAEWLAKDNDARVSILVLEGDPAKGTFDVSITLAAGHETKKDEGDAEALVLNFEIKGGAVVGPTVKATYIG
ncbi:MAG: hypothetical protein U0270_00675 [Labilithrix sp.]